MGIVDEDVRKVRDESDIIRIITEHTQLKKTGAQWMGLCPFHGEKSPSFSVNAEKGVYYCFGCQVSGDVIDFVREIEGLDFAGSVEFLAAKTGIPLRYTDHNEGRRRNRRKEHAEIVQKAVDFYHQRLLEDPAARPARDYLRSRGYGGEVARQFQIGWAPDDWSLLSRALGLSDDDLRATGLGGINKRGGQYDFFRARIVFPIFDAQGSPVGFGGRKLPDGEGPKYKNTSDAAEYYSKSEVLYGLHWAKAEAGRLDELVVCEGYTDVIGCHLVGIERAVATCGTALTPSHARLIGRFAKRVVLAFDADGAGQAAAERVYAWEEEFGLQFAVAALPEGADPGEPSGALHPMCCNGLSRMLAHSSSSGWTACWFVVISVRPRDGLEQPPRPWRWLPNIRMPWCETSTPWALPIDARSASMNSVAVAQSPQHRFAPVI
ncbi:MAG: hypothetical protein Ct9H300mP12_09730 [Acidimicrobiales bacterium]|nr:MAG: hypothetical protein Ct9H300mP12_09730 [Acidimicrobiales bacterium]